MRNLNEIELKQCFGGAGDGPSEWTKYFHGWQGMGFALAVIPTAVAGTTALVPAAAVGLVAAGSVGAGYCYGDYILSRNEGLQKAAEAVGTTMQENHDKYVEHCKKHGFPQDGLMP